MKLVGIDIGTTSISGIVLEMTGCSEVLESVTIQNDSSVQSSVEWERIQNPEKILNKAQKLLDTFIDKYSDIAYIGLTGQMHGIVYVDDAGKSVSPLYTWQDERGNIIQPSNGKNLVENIEEQYHIKVASGYGLVTHIYNLRNNCLPENYKTFCTIMDYLGMYLTRRNRPLVHVSNAASFGFFDVESYSFETEILKQLQVEERCLPEVTSQITSLGTYRGIQVTVALGDNQASFLGSVGTQPDTLLVNMGTGGQISVLADTCFTAKGIEARPFIEGKYLLAGASLCGGKAYAVLENFFRKYMNYNGDNDCSQYDVMAQMAYEGKKCRDRMKITTTFCGTRENPELRGKISNISIDNFTPEGMTYGVLEGMSRELYELYTRIYEGTGIKIHKIIGSGNGIRRNSVLKEIIEEMFGAELIFSKYNEEAAAGAAISSLYIK